MKKDLLANFLKDPALSTYRERLIEHIFIADIVQAAIKQGQIIMVSRSEIDVWGYDIVLNCDKVSRSIQLKSSLKGSIKASLSLAGIPGSCIVRAMPSVSETESKIFLTYKIFESGATKGLALDNFAPAKASRWIKDKSGKAIRKVRSKHVSVPQSAFGRSMNAEKLFSLLFPQLD